MAKLPQDRKRPPTSGSIKPGQVLNPGGRLAVPKEIREAFRELSPRAIATLTRIVEFGENDTVQLKAAEVILDRAWGRTPAAPEDVAAIASANPLAGVTAEVLIGLLRAKSG